MTTMTIAAQRSGEPETATGPGRRSNAPHIPVAAKRYVLKQYRWRAEHGARDRRVVSMYWVLDWESHRLAEEVTKTGTVPQQALDRYRAASYYARRMSRLPWRLNWTDAGNDAQPPYTRRGRDGLACYPRAAL